MKTLNPDLMEKKEIFFLIEYGGEYSGFWRSIIAASFNGENLEKRAEIYNKKQKHKRLSNRSYMEVETIPFET